MSAIALFSPCDATVWYAYFNWKTKLHGMLNFSSIYEVSSFVEMLVCHFRSSWVSPPPNWKSSCFPSTLLRTASPRSDSRLLCSRFLDIFCLSQNLNRLLLIEILSKTYFKMILKFVPKNGNICKSHNHLVCIAAPVDRPRKILKIFQDSFNKKSCQTRSGTDFSRFSFIPENGFCLRSLWDFPWILKILKGFPWASKFQDFPWIFKILQSSSRFSGAAQPESLKSCWNMFAMQWVSRLTYMCAYIWWFGFRIPPSVTEMVFQLPQNLSRRITLSVQKRCTNC